MTLDSQHYSLLRAVTSRDLPGIEKIIASGVDVNYRYSSTKPSIGGYQVLHTASSQRDVAIVRKLLTAGADVNGRDNGMRTPLHYVLTLASEYDLPKQPVVNELIRHGADVNARDECGNTPLSAAIGSIDFETVELLIEHGALVNGANNNGRTLLHHLFYNSYSESVTAKAQIIIRAGCDLNVKDNAGRTVEDVARESGKLAELREAITLSKSLKE